jgi:hypothetical protein
MYNLAYAAHMHPRISRVTAAIYCRLLRVNVHFIVVYVHIRCMRSLKLNVATDAYSVWAKVLCRRPFAGGSIGDHSTFADPHPTRHARDGAHVPNYYGASILQMHAKI